MPRWPPNPRLVVKHCWIAPGSPRKIESSDSAASAAISPFARPMATVSKTRVATCEQNVFVAATPILVQLQ
jgi:hypothetical protein